MARELEVVVKIDADAARRALADVDKRLSGVGRTGRKTNTALSQSVAIFKGFIGAQVVIGAVTKAFSFAADAAIGMNASLEQSRLQFETLMGSARVAQDHVRGLFEFAAKTPFETGPIIQASKFLQVFGGEALNSRDQLQLLGDTAAATGAPIQDLAFWTGRLFAQLQAGRPFGEAAQRLTELAVLTPQARNQMEQMAKAGASAADIFAVFQGQLGEFTGAMEKQAETWGGVTSTFVETLQLTIADRATGIFDGLKKSIQAMTGVLERINMTPMEKQVELLPQLEARFDKLTEAMQRKEAAGLAVSFQEQRTLEVLERQIKTTKALMAGEEDLAAAKARVAEKIPPVVEGTDNLAASTAAAAKAQKTLNDEFAQWVASLDSFTIEGPTRQLLTFEEALAGVGTQLAVVQTGTIEATPPTMGLTTATAGLHTEIRRLGVEDLPAATLATLDFGLGLEGVKTIAETAPTFLDNLGSSVRNLITDFTDAGTLINGVWQGIFGPQGFIAGLAAQGMQKVADLVIGGVKKLGSAIGGFFKNLFGGPSEAELAGRDAANTFIDEVVATSEVGADRVAQAVADGWDPRLAEFALAVQDMFVEAGGSADDAMKVVGMLFDSIEDGPAAVQAVIDMILQMVAALKDANAEASSLNGNLGGGGDLSPGPRRRGTVAMQHGGIVTGPTRALIGEAGPEAVIPLDRAGGFGNVTIDMRGSVVSSDRDLDRLADRVSRAIARRSQLRTRFNAA